MLHFTAVGGYPIYISPNKICAVQATMNATIIYFEGGQVAVTTSADEIAAMIEKPMNDFLSQIKELLND